MSVISAAITGAPTAGKECKLRSPESALPARPPPSTVCSLPGGSEWGLGRVLCAILVQKSAGDEDLGPGPRSGLEAPRGQGPAPAPASCLGHAVSPALGTVSGTQQVFNKDLLTGGLIWALPLRCAISDKPFAVSSLYFSHLKWDWTRWSFIHPFL